MTASNFISEYKGYQYKEREHTVKHKALKLINIEVNIRIQFTEGEKYGIPEEKPDITYRNQCVKEHSFEINH